ncbi:MAG: hypothetical protein ACTSPG_10180 [Candidatus Hodarchaeales archaeon]
MKISVEPERLAKLFKNATISGMLDGVNLEFTEKGLKFRDISLRTTTVIGVFNKNFFVSFEAEKEVIPLTKSLVDALSYGFKDKKITMRTEGNDVILEGSHDKYKEPLRNPEIIEFPVKTVVNEYGIVPEKIVPNVIVQVDVKNLKLPDAKKFKFVSDGKTLKAIITDVGTYSRDILIEKTVKMEEVTAIFQKEFFDNVITNFNGKVWLQLNKDYVVVSQKEPQFLLTYGLGAIEED